MMRSGDQLRLNSGELRQLSIDTGCSNEPKTVDEYNQRLQGAADYWRQFPESPDATLLAHMLEMDKIDKEAANAAPVVESLLAEQQYTG